MSPASATRKGKPLVFLGLLVLCWMSVRFTAIALWPSFGEPGTGLQIASQTHASHAERYVDATGGPAVPSVDRQVAERGDSMGVEGLEPLPPAHLAVPIGEPAAAGHNTLWMSASGAISADQTGREAGGAESSSDFETRF